MDKLNVIFSEIFCVSPDDYTNIQFEYGNSCVSVKPIDEYLNSNPEYPTLIVGWNFVKSHFKDVKISQKKIKKNLYWTFSTEEDKKQYDIDIKKFILKSIKEFFPKNYKTFDSIINGDILNQNDIFSEIVNFCFFDKNNILYIYNDQYFTGINLESIDYVGQSSVQYIEFIIKKYNLIFFNYENIPQILKKEDFNVITLENLCWICYGVQILEIQFYKFSPLLLNEKYYAFLMHQIHDKLKCDLTNDEKIVERFSKKDVITHWLSSQSIYFSNKKTLQVEYSNKRALTGRIYCNDKKFNPQFLPKTSPVRSEIVSRFKKGSITVFDYVSFETKISLFLSKNEGFIKKYKNCDLHTEISKIIFDTKEVTPAQRTAGKQINHSIIYGASDEKLKTLLQANNINEKLILKIKEFLKPIIDNSKKIQEDYKKNNVLINPYHTVIHPKKEWATYNNFIQSIAADIVVDKLFKIKHLLENYKSKFLYQVFDSFVFDIHPDESDLILQIKNLLEKSGQYFFETEHISGNSLMNCTNQNIEEEIDAIS